MGSSGQHTDTDTTAKLFAALERLTGRVDYLEIGERRRNETQQEIKSKAMYLENVVLNIWDTTMGTKPKTKPKKKK